MPSEMSAFVAAFARAENPDLFLLQITRQQQFEQIAAEYYSIVERLVRNLYSANWKHLDPTIAPFIPNNWPTDNPVSRIQALSLLLEQLVSPLFGSDRHFKNNLALSKWVLEVSKKHPRSYAEFLTEIGNNCYLSRARRDGLNLYVRLFAAASDIRPVLPEWNRDFPNAVDIPSVRVTGNQRFDLTKTLFVDAHESLSRLLTLISAIENIEHRDDHNLYLPHPAIKNYAPKSMRDFHDKAHAPKIDMVASPIGIRSIGALDPQLRNGIGHYAVRLDEYTGLIHYAIDVSGEASKQLEYGSFLLRLLRLMLRIVEGLQLIKILYSSALGAGIEIR